MIVYISGKIGEKVVSEATRQKFMRAERMLRAKGHEVHNPASRSWQYWIEENWRVACKTAAPHMDKYTYALMKDIQKISKCDAVYMLEDFKESPGAMAEYHFALATGKRLLFASRFQACEHLVRRMYMEVAAGRPPSEYLSLSRLDAEIAYGKKHIHETWWQME
jgi:nucleoside 2-deoxyribosyltransferase